MMNRNNKAIVFDFDGTLILGGPDKSIHIMFSSWMACYETGFRVYLNPGDLSHDVDQMIAAYVQYPGSPRFQQLSAIVNSLVNGRPESVETPADLDIGKPLQMEYPKVMELYNQTYSDLNSIAAEKFWKPFPDVKETLELLSQSYDLYIASGVTEDILQNDIDHHHFDRSLFRGIYGGNRRGGSDKGSILKRIKQTGYDDILFIGDSSKDQEYAGTAEVRFFRIQSNADFSRLLSCIDGDFPDEKDVWSYTQEEIDLFRRKLLYLLHPDKRHLNYSAMTDYINERN